jgi:phage-related protein
MPEITARCHELRIQDGSNTWRIIYRIDQDAILILEVFAKKTGQTPERVKQDCRRRLSQYDQINKRGR